MKLWIWGWLIVAVTAFLSWQTYRHWGGGICIIIVGFVVISMVESGWDITSVRLQLKQIQLVTVLIAASSVV